MRVSIIVSIIVSMRVRIIVSMRVSMRVSIICGVLIKSYLPIKNYKRMKS